MDLARMKLPSALLTLALLAGCSTQTIWLSKGDAGTPESEEMHIFFVGGVGQTQVVDAAKVCGGAEKVSRVESQQRALDVLIGALSSNIVTPLTARVYCLPD